MEELLRLMRVLDQKAEQLETETEILKQLVSCTAEELEDMSYQPGREGARGVQIHFTSLVK